MDNNIFNDSQVNTSTPDAEAIQQTEQSSDGKPKKKYKEPRKISVLLTVFIVLLCCIITAVATVSVMQHKSEATINELRNDLSRFSKLESLLDYVESKYIRDASEESLMESAYSAIFSSIDDPYSWYMSADSYEAYVSSKNSTYSGIGCNVTFDTENDAIYVYRIYPDSPSEIYGLQVGDLIVKVNDVVVSKDTYSQAVSEVQGETGTSVTLTVKRNEETLELVIVRDTVQSQAVWYEKLDNGIAYLEITSFSGSYITEQFKEALQQSIDDQCTAYIFDVRNNPGGDLTVICNILDLLLPKGVILHIIDADGNDTTRESENDPMIQAPMVVLCNQNTASAAELFTADLRDYQLATIIGVTTYGKGTMQTIQKLSDGSAIKLTDHYYNPESNVSYDGVGITPDIVVELSDEQLARYYLLTHDEDPQFQAAIQELIH